MKNNLKYFLLLSLFSILFLNASITFAQEKDQVNTGLGCIDPVVRQQAQSIKDHYLKQGFTVYKDAMISFESMIPYPVIVHLTQGHLYQLCYVANPSMSNMHLTLYDGNDVKIDERSNIRNREQPNYIICTFTPPTTDEYLISMMQKLKNKTVCGSFFILKADNDKVPDNIEPYTEEKK